MNPLRRLALVSGLAAPTVVGLACGSTDEQEKAEEPLAQVAPQAQSLPNTSGTPLEPALATIPRGAPLVNMTYEGYEGTVYRQDPLRTEEAANLDEDDFDLFGVTTESNLIAPGSGNSLDVYRLKGNEDGHLYTFEPGQSIPNEDGTTITIDGGWVRWVVAD